MASKNPTKVITGPRTKMSYLHVLEPASINGSNPKYSGSFLIPKDSPDVEKITKAIQAAYEDGQAKLKGSSKVAPALAALKTPLRDGDAERPGDEAYAGYYFVNANNSSKPGVVDKDLNPIMDLQTIPHVSIAKDYARIMNRCAEQLGLTPSSRSRLIAGDPSGGTADDMEDLLGGGG